MSIYELEGIPKAYSMQAKEVQQSREAKIQHLLQPVRSHFLILLSISMIFFQFSTTLKIGIESCKINI